MLIKIASPEMECFLLAARYGMMWPGVEPERGQYNQSYIDAAKDIVTRYVIQPHEFGVVRTWLNFQ